MITKQGESVINLLSLIYPYQEFQVTSFKTRLEIHWEGGPTYEEVIDDIDLNRASLFDQEGFGDVVFPGGLKKPLYSVVLYHSEETS